MSDVVDGFRDRLAQVRHSLRSRDGEPMPVSLIAVSLALSAMALIVGLLLGWESFVSNIAASLVILGPGLFISNILIGLSRENKTTTEIEPLLKLVTDILLTLLPVVREVAICANLSIPSSLAPEVDGVGRVVEAQRLFDDTRRFLSAALQDGGESLPERISVTPTMLSIAGFSTVESLVGNINVYRSCPEAILFASVLVSTYNDRFIPTWYAPEVSPGREVYSVQLGFGEFQRHALEMGVLSKEKSPLHVGTYQFLNGLANLLEMSRSVLHSLQEAAPAPIAVKLKKVA